MRTNIGLQLNQALAAVDEEIQFASRFAALGEQFQKLPSDMELPPSYIVEFSGKHIGEIDEEIKNQFSQYCNRYSVVAMVTACEVYLQSVLFWAMLARKIDNDRYISAAEFLTLKQDWLTKLWNLGGLALLKECINQVDGNIESIPSRQWFSDINKVRRCLIHRSGRVKEQDIGSSGMLQVTWMRIVLLANGKEIELPHYTEKEAKIQWRLDNETLTWNKGQIIELSAQSCQNIAVTLLTFCSDVNKEILHSVEVMFSKKPPPSPLS